MKHKLGEISTVAALDRNNKKLQEAIEHYDDIITDCVLEDKVEQFLEYTQLKAWLEELTYWRSAMNEQIRQVFA